ncbi:MAG: hypothetical protein GY817_02465 [bacterium]|nr:hypothetical protein [bacterium]
MKLKNIVIFALLLVFSIGAILFYVWQKYAVTNINYQIQHSYDKKQQLEQQKKELIIKKSQLELTASIKKEAESRFGMRDFKESEMRILEVSR